MQFLMNNRIKAMSSYLAFRYVVYPNVGFSNTVIPAPLNSFKHKTEKVFGADDIERIIKDILGKCDWNKTGILLSGGMDSAILASYAPAGTKAYTIKFIAENAVDETIMAKKYAKQCNLDLKIVEVTFEDYLNYSPDLMRHRRCPLHQIECAVYKAALQSKYDGINFLIMGNGADYQFGGLNKLLSRDWSFDELVIRYSIVMPQTALKQYHSISDAYEPFRIGTSEIDLLRFLKDVHGICSVPSFANPLDLASVRPIEPYEHMEMGLPLDIERIRKGDSKYFIRELFSRRYEEIEQPDKIPFSRPMNDWLKGYNSPKREEFILNCTENMTGDQKWLVYCLEWFLNLIDSGDIV